MYVFGHIGVVRTTDHLLGVVVSLFTLSDSTQNLFFAKILNRSDLSVGSPLSRVLKHLELLLPQLSCGNTG